MTVNRHRLLLAISLCLLALICPIGSAQQETERKPQILTAAFLEAKIAETESANKKVHKLWNKPNPRLFR
jgi:hypothetical protein